MTIQTITTPKKNGAGNGATQPLIPWTPAPRPTRRVDVPEITYDIVNVTPALAAEWLQHNLERNRTPSRKRIEKYKASMRDGRWRTTHEGIAFDVHGNLIDGQHRLFAISEMPEGTKIKLLVFRYQTDAHAMMAINVGAPRRASDAFVVENIADRGNARRCAAAASAIYNGLNAIKSTLEHDEVAAVYLAHKQWIDAAVEFNGKLITSPVVGAIAYAMPIDPAGVAEFATQLSTSVGLVEGSGAHRLHEALLEYRSSSQADEPRRMIFYKTLSAIKCHLLGKHHRLQSPRGSGVPDVVQWFMDRRKELGLSVGAKG